MIRSLVTEVMFSGGKGFRAGLPFFEPAALFTAWARDFQFHSDDQLRGDDECTLCCKRT